MAAARRDETTMPRRDDVPPGFLADLAPSTRARLLADAILIDVPAGALVYRDNERPRVILVIRGLLRVFLRSTDGREVTARYIRAGEIAGLPLVVGGPGPESIQAMTRAHLAALRVDQLRRLLAIDPAVARACAEELVRQLYQAFDELSGQAFLSLRQRIIFHLLNLAAPGAGGEFIAHTSHEELAEAVATSREAVTRNLHRIRDDGLISLTRDEIVLRDPIGMAREVRRGAWKPRDDRAGGTGTTRSERARLAS